VLIAGDQANTGQTDPAVYSGAQNGAVDVHNRGVCGDVRRAAVIARAILSLIVSELEAVTAQAMEIATMAVVEQNKFLNILVSPQ
jgi:hypothetical protein